MGDAVLILTTFENRESAARVVSILVEEHLAACGNIVPGVESIYRWREKVERAEEVLVLLKTVAANIVALRARLLELHPYEVPEFLTLFPAEVSPAYLAWLQGSCAE